jgi:hypothetical protein
VFQPHHIGHGQHFIFGHGNGDLIKYQFAGDIDIGRFRSLLEHL